MLTSGSHVGLAASAAAAVAAAYHEHVCVGLYLVMLACSRLSAVWQTVYKTRHLCILVCRTVALLLSLLTESRVSLRGCCRTLVGAC